MKQAKFHIPKPSEFMRARRPHLYSDSESTEAYRLSESELSHHLDSLAERNQHKDFENFARKICELEICPNLRPQTGPEAGGDGKVDAETYPVDSRIFECWFVGSESGGQEKSAFAVSTQKQWERKVRSDVKKIVETKRGYKKIFFVTNQPAQARKRLRIQDESKDRYDVELVILDREWLIERVFSGRHKDLAYECLKAGELDPDSVKHGPNDFERQQLLDGVEDRLRKCGDEPSERTRAVPDTLDAALLSRLLEKPHHETEGRFERAIRFARKYGEPHQLLKAVHERARTRFWWFDDVDGMLELYEQAEALAFATNHAYHIEKVCDLFQLCFRCILSKQENATPLPSLKIRASRLKSKLTELATDDSRPNNALYAEALLLLHSLSEKAFEGQWGKFDDIWRGLSDVIDKAVGLGEFPASLLSSIIEGLSPLMPDSEALDSLVDKLAEFMSQRNKELEAGRIYLKQGERKLNAGKPIDAIKWLGRAVLNFAKDESREEQTRALHCLSTSYHEAGLLWAAHGTALVAIAQISALSEKDAEFREETIPLFILFTMISLRLGHITDFLKGMQYLWIASYHFLNGEKRDKLHGALAELDRHFACFLVGLPNQQLRRLIKLPDILEQLTLLTSRTVLLYRLGYLDALRGDGSIPEEETDEQIHDMMETLAAQPACRDLPREIVLLDDEFKSVRTTVMGVKACINSSANSDGFLIAETHASFLESFASTLLDSGLFPHRESLKVQIEPSADVSEASIKFTPESSMLSVSLPADWDIKEPDCHKQFIEYLAHFGGNALEHILTPPDHSKFLDEFIVAEQAFHRAALFCRSGISRHRVLKEYVGRLSDWSDWIKRSYDLLQNAPVVSPKPSPDAHSNRRPPKSPSDKLRNHSDLSVSSIINMDLWNAAGWKGMAYAPMVNRPPLLGLLFNSEEKGCSIFREWRERFGEKDVADEIRITVVKGIDRSNPFHYRTRICREIDTGARTEHEGRQLVIVHRIHTLHAKDHKSLDCFLSELTSFGYYLLAPCFIGKDGKPEFIQETGILKRKFHVREAWQIGCHDIDAPAIHLEDNVIIPKGVENPPVHGLFEWRRKIEAGQRGGDQIR